MFNNMVSIVTYGGKIMDNTARKIKKEETGFKVVKGLSKREIKKLILVNKILKTIFAGLCIFGILFILGSIETPILDLHQLVNRIGTCFVQLILFGGVIFGFISCIRDSK